MSCTSPLRLFSLALVLGCTEAPVSEPLSDPGSMGVVDEVTAFAPEGDVVLAVRRPPRCPVAVDAQAVATCSQQRAAALVQGVGYNTLANAVAATPAGGTMVVCPGTYPGPMVLPAPITVRAADPRPWGTVMDGQHSRHALEASATVRVVGLTLANGYDLIEGGGGFVDGTGSELQCLTVTQNTSSGVGGGLAVRGDNSLVANSAFFNNYADSEGAALSTGFSGMFTITDSVFARNTSAHSAGAINAAADLYLERVSFYGNVADYGGGALQWGSRDPHVLSVIDSVFEGNHAGYEGGAMDLGTWGADQVRIRGTTFRGNDSSGAGGAIVFGSWGQIDALIEDSSFSGNMADDAGAIDVGGWMRQGAAIRIRRTDFRANEATNGASVLNMSTHAPSASLALDHVRVADNVGALGAFTVRSGDAFSCAGCQFAGGAHDNVPADYAYGTALEPNAAPNFVY